MDDSTALKDLIYQINIQSKNRLQRELAVFDLTLPQFRVLRCLKNHPDGLTMSQLSDQCLAVLPTMTGIINRLSARGLVLRTKNNHDKRSKSLALTAAGEAVLAEIELINQRLIDRFLDGLEKDKLEIFLRLMQRYLLMMNTEPGKKVDTNE